ncbi:putative RNA-directed DNA polymerase, partial [Tanacetum coccineum]
MGIGRQFNVLYLFDVDKACKIVSNNCISSYFVSKSLWHQRLSHPSDQVLDVLKTSLNIDSQTASDHLYDTCNKAKQIRELSPLSDHKSSKIDDFSRAIWVYMLKGKDDVYDSITNFVQMISTQFETNIKTFRSDNGTEFVNNILQTFFNLKCILHQTACVYTPQQNGITEKKHRIPSFILSGKSPYFFVYGHDPSLSHFRVFGCLCYATILNNHDKFSGRPNDKGRVSSNDDGTELSPDVN